jgi:hypothetical protein
MYGILTERDVPGLFHNESKLLCEIKIIVEYIIPALVELLGVGQDSLASHDELGPQVIDPGRSLVRNSPLCGNTQTLEKCMQADRIRNEFIEKTLGPVSISQRNEPVLGPVRSLYNLQELTVVILVGGRLVAVYESHCLWQVIIIFYNVLEVSGRLASQIRNDMLRNKRTRIRTLLVNQNYGKFRLCEPREIFLPVTRHYGQTH